MTAVDRGTGESAMKFNDVFKSLDSVKKCLHSDKYFHMPEVQELLKIFSDNFSVVHDEVLDRSQRKVFVVLEGIDASGKTTIGKRMSKLIGGQMLITPPPSLAGLRAHFDKQDRLLRRAFYSLGNYLAAQQVKQIYKTQPVIMDRFWHSTAAYAIAEHAVEDNNGLVPPAHDPVYEWPSDLVKPDIVFFLSVSESKRLDRLLRRNKEITREELKMKDDKALREALANALLLMREPALQTVDSDVIVEDVLAQMKVILENNFQIQLPEIEPYVPKA